MLLIGADYKLKIKNLYITKSEPGANHVGTTHRKNIKTSKWRQVRRLFNNYNVLYNDNAFIKPPETAVFCYTEKK